MSSVVTILGGGWKAGHLYQTNRASSAVYDGKVAILWVLELRFCVCYLGISKKC